MEFARMQVSDNGSFRSIGSHGFGQSKVAEQVQDARYSFHLSSKDLSTFSR